MSMARLISSLDHEVWSRKISPTDTVEIVRRSKHRSDVSVSTIAKLSSKERNEHEESILHLMIGAGLKSASLTREIACHLKEELEREFGQEGCKRYSEISYIAFSQSSRADAAALVDFWADFRTFLDAEYFVNLGRPFRVEHFFRPYALVNDSKGARAEHDGGSGINLSSVTENVRNDRKF